MSALPSDPARLVCLYHVLYRPGYGKANLTAPASIAYNKDVSMNTVRWAIVDWLNDAHQTSIWSVCACRCLPYDHLYIGHL
jgi:hypothetical protein